MNGFWLLLGSLIYFALGYLIYGRFIAKNVGVDANKPCPSKTMQDGIDYVPTHPAVLFGHHFASIAGAGPIVGPILAALYGWLPATIWILLGCVFIGAMHDFAAMFLSVRNEGRSIAYVIEKELGYIGRQIFLLFCFVTLILVVAIFTLNVADGFIATPSVATASILFIFMAPFFGIATNKKILSLTEATIIFVPLLFCCVWLGTIIPFDMVAICGSVTVARTIWIIALLYYAATASIIPVWLLLQPRDYLNSYLLYAMMILGVVGILCAQPTVSLPAVNATKGLIPNVLPLLFVTIACGACSGFHALVSSGTSSKQIANEKHMLPVAYGGMLVEGVLAIIAVISIGYMNMDSVNALLTGPNKVPAPTAFAQGLAHFCESCHINYNIGYTFISLAISAFMMTSLDTATRLGRFVWQELIMPNSTAGQNATAATAAPERSVMKAPALFGNRWVATLIIILISVYLALSGDGNKIWPIFGAANQLLAALTLLCITLWRIRTKRSYLFAIIPMLFMLVISVWALFILITQNWGNNIVLVSFSIILLMLAAFFIVLGIIKVKKNLQQH